MNRKKNAGLIEDEIAVTVVIPVKNEEINLGNCLKYLKRFSEVVVVDSSSQDLTPTIAKNAGAVYLNFEWDGKYPKKRNWTLATYAFANNWVLFLDADEFLDGKFCNALSKAVDSDLHNGYWLNYTNYFLGRQLKHGLEQRKLACFKVGCGQYEKIDEEAWSRLDMEIHEHPLINGPVGEIKQPIAHNDDRGIERFITRHLEYARWESCRMEVLRRDNRNNHNHTRRQKFKYENIDKWWYPIFYFLYTYIYKFGFLDGAPGFFYAFYKLWYFFTVLVLIKYPSTGTVDEKHKILFEKLPP